jgi:di/tricarboxylate transporter
VIGLTRNSRLRPSKLLIPLAFASLLGGMATLFTTANLLVSAGLVEHGLKPYGILDFLPAGLPMAAAGIAFVTLAGPRLLPELPFGGQRAPEQAGRGLPETYGLDRTVQEVYVKPGSPLAGLSVAGGGWGERLGLNVVGISRGGGVRLSPAPGEAVLPGDVVIFTGTLDAEEAAEHGLLFTADPGWRGQFVTSQMSLVEAVLAPRSALAGKTLREIQFRDKYDLSVLAIWREGTIIRDSLAEIPLRFGDALLIHGPQYRVELLKRDPDFLVLVEDTAGPESPRKPGWPAA